MIVLCPHCSQRNDVSKLPSGQAVTCSQCQKPFTTPTALAAPPFAAPVPQGPIFIPVPVPMAQPSNPLDFTDDEREDERRERREEREERREERHVRKAERGYRHQDVGSNPAGVIGFALGVSTMILLLSGLLFQKELKFYAGVTGTLGFPGAMTALVCGLIGLTRPGRSKVLSIIATALGALILLLFLPLLWLLILGDET